MGRHHENGTSLVRLLCRFWQTRDRDRWLVHGRDERGQRVAVVLGVCEHGVTLSPDRSGPIVLAPMQAGRLRGAIRDAIVALDQPSLALPRAAAPPCPVRTIDSRTPRARTRVILSPHPESMEPTSGSTESAHFTEESYGNAANDVRGPVWPNHDQDTGRLAA